MEDQVYFSLGVSFYCQKAGNVVLLDLHLWRPEHSKYSLVLKDYIHTAGLNAQFRFFC